MMQESVWVNGVVPIGQWYKRTLCTKWHERLRLSLVRLLLHSLNKNYHWTRADIATGASDRTEEILRWLE